MSGTESRIRRAHRTYRILLRVLPPDYRASVEAEWCQVFRDEYAEILDAGAGRAVPAFWLRVLLDLALTVPAAWRSGLRQTSRGVGPSAWFADVVSCTASSRGIR